MTQSTPPPLPPIEVGYGYGYAQAPRRSNGFAIASLVLGILGCIPFLTGLLAIVLGVIGIRKTRDSSVGGKGLAIAGMILGIISVLGWSGFGGLMGYAYRESKPAGVVAKQFLRDISAGNINAAMANSTGLTAAQLQTQNRQMISLGPLQSVSISSFNLSTFNSQSIMSLGGAATFASGPKTCTFNLVKTGGIYKVKSFWIQ
ncbi:MAG TPA: DUF4190 domain-containing protein [Tepidisphaeraceae bacterium]|jgi:hypothetical protein|nr:DUF4190 domain-containing protein [Tepidisphaeraceae bacterium]